jgi:hypothetical protein
LSTAVASPDPSETAEETETESNNHHTREQADSPITRISDANPIAKSEQAQAHFSHDNSPNNNTEYKTASNISSDTRDIDHSSNAFPILNISDTGITDHRSDRNHDQAHHPARTSNGSKCKFVYDPGGNNFNTKDGASRDDDDGASTSTSISSASGTADTHHVEDRDRDKSIFTALDLKCDLESVHADFPVSDATPSRLATKLPASLPANLSSTDMAPCRLPLKNLTFPPDFTRIMPAVHLDRNNRNGNTIDADNSKSSVTNAATTISACIISTDTLSPASVSTAACDNEPDPECENEHACAPPLEVPTHSTDNNSSNSSRDDTANAGTNIFTNNITSTASSASTLNVATVAVTNNDTNNAAIANSSSSIVNISTHVDTADTAVKTNASNNTNSDAHSSSDDTTSTGTVSVITACTFSTSSLDFDTVASDSSSNSKCSDAIDKNNASNIVHNNEPEDKCTRMVRAPPFDVVCEAMPLVAPPLDKPGEPPPAHPFDSTHPLPHSTNATPSPLKSNVQAHSTIVHDLMRTPPNFVDIVFTHFTHKTCQFLGQNDFDDDRNHQKRVDPGGSKFQPPGRCRDSLCSGLETPEFDRRPTRPMPGARVLALQGKIAASPFLRVPLTLIVARPSLESRTTLFSYFQISSLVCL